MTAPNNYAYWTDTMNFGKPQGNFHSTSFSAYDSSSFYSTFQEEIQQTTVTQLTNTPNKSIISVE